jgi:hypothetical protein
MSDIRMEFDPRMLILQRVQRVNQRSVERGLVVYFVTV